MKSRVLTIAVLAALWISPAWGQVGDPASPYGVNVHWVGGPGDQGMVGTMMDAGVDWLQMDLHWFRVEPSQDNFDWSHYDNVVNYLQSRSRPVNVYAFVHVPPAWATNNDTLGNYRLKSTADYVDVLTRAVQRYAGTIDYWGFYNEPVATWDGSTSDYINEIIKPGADAIRAASATAKVVGPDLAHSPSWATRRMPILSPLIRFPNRPRWRSY